MIRELPTRPQTAPVQNLILYLTEDCNLRCTYCFVPKKPRSMTREVALQAVDFLLNQAISGTLRRVEITFFGGEPFLRADLMEEVIRHARRPGPRGHRASVTFAATTNGTLAGPRIEKLIREARMKLLISLDGDEAANAHRPFVNGRPSLELVSRNLPGLVAAAAWSTCRMTYHPESLNLLANVRHALALGAPSVVLSPVVEADWTGCEQRLEAALDELERWFLSECRAGRLPPLELTWQALRQWHYVQQGGSRPARTCGIGTSLLAVTTDGQVLPCHRFLHMRHAALGHVESPQLSDDRWQYVHLSSRDILGCETCLAEPVCGGGCRVLALDYGTGLTGTHPHYCMLTRLHSRMVYRLYHTLMSENNLILTRGLSGRPGLPGALRELATT